MQGDHDLIAANILKGKEIFGVAGTLEKGYTAASFGFSKVAIGAVVPSSNSTDITINHGLGVNPKLILIYTNSEPASYYAVKNILYDYDNSIVTGTIKSSSYDYAIGLGASSWSGTHTQSVKVSSPTYCYTHLSLDYGSTAGRITCSYLRGLEYRWIAVA